MFTHRSIDVFYKLISTLCFSGNTSSPKQRNCKLLPATFIQISGELYLIHVVFLCSEWYDTKQKKFNLKQNKQQLNQRFFTMGKETSLTCIDYPCQFSNEFPASPFANIPTYACE